MGGRYWRWVEQPRDEQHCCYVPELPQRASRLPDGLGRYG
jgi:hypothetical protein